MRICFHELYLSLELEGWHHVIIIKYCKVFASSLCYSQVSRINTPIVEIKHRDFDPLIQPLVVIEYPKSRGVMRPIIDNYELPVAVLLLI
jgi:hypothetical protein